LRRANWPVLTFNPAGGKQHPMTTTMLAAPTIPVEAPPVAATTVDLRPPRPHVRGKFIFVGEEKLYLRGVTYGTFRPGTNGDAFHLPEIVDRDFAQIAANGMNAVRTYAAPPRWLLDTAWRHGLRVMVGIPWEQHIAFLDDRRRSRAIEQGVRRAVRTCRDHPALLGYAIGNEIPAGIVRWTGRGRVERFLDRIVRAAKDEDPGGLVTYVNYPSTEYLQVASIDFLCFNVYLESRERLEAYLARLHNLAGNRPLVMAELGLDSRRNGAEAQARALDWQVRTAFASGCAGAFVFAWTDEWHRGGYDIDDWDFGLTDRNRHPKPALHAVRRAFAETPFPAEVRWPRISVVVCTYNGERCIRDCLEALRKLDYPNFEVIVVDDGSTDGTGAIAREYDFLFIRTPNGGLSSARNVGLRVADGEIVAYIDDDAYPDPDWLKFLAATFMSSTHAGVGGPNIPPPEDGFIAGCVACAPGGPIHILLSDLEAEHIPGCNMAFRRDELLAIGGFDPQFRTAGDDVDVCWELQERGHTLGFSPAAVVWHHRRNSVGAYWRQQRGYGKAEALLERKWPQKYNALGHVSWSGRLYNNGHSQGFGPRRGRIYQGTWGSALFQSVYEPAPGLLRSLPLMPEWAVLLLTLATLGGLGLGWSPLLAALPLFVIAAAATIVLAIHNGSRALPSTYRFRAVTAFLHLIQPFARLRGRLSLGLTLWRRRETAGFTLPWSRTFTIWSEQGRAAHEWLRSLEATLQADRAVVVRGGDFDHWDLEVRVGALGAVRILMAVEDHGGGKQLVRFRSWPERSPIGFGLSLLLAGLAIGAAFDQSLMVSGFLGLSGLALAAPTFRQCAGATAATLDALRRIEAGVV
jgi:GT2 family glycosyltransferase